MSKYLPQLAIFIFGFVSAATEMIIIRQLTPIIGSTPFITSILLSFSLFGLALGLTLSRKFRPEDLLSKATAIASIIIGLVLAYPLMYLFFQYVDRLFHNSIYTLFLFSTLIILPIFTCFGLAISSGTVVIYLFGAAAGAMLSTILFMGWLGLPWTIIVCSGLLLATIFLRSPQLNFKKIVVVAITIAFVAMFNLTTIDPHTIATNSYANYHRVDNTVFPTASAPGKSLIINNSSSSFVEYKSLRGYPYIEMIKKIIFNDLKLRNKDILVLGAGGFSITAAGSYQNNVTYVDIDPKLERIVQEHYLKETNGKFIGADARSFLRTNQQQFDVIISDTFVEKINIPTHLSTKEYYQLIEQNLSANGLALFNTIISPTMNDQFSQQTDNTIRAAFNNCVVIPYEYNEFVSNVLYVCKKNSPDRSVAVYSDHQHHKLSDIAALNSGMILNKSPTKP